MANVETFFYQGEIVERIQFRFENGFQGEGGGDGGEKSFEEVRNKKSFKAAHFDH